MVLSKRRFRILSLDGGGTFALIQAKALADLYPGQSGHQVLSHFDMVVGCSGGSIVAAGLLEDLSPMDIFRLFDTRKNREALFGALPWYRSKMYQATRFLASPVGQRFSTQGKRNFLHSILPRNGKLPLHALPDVLAPRRQQWRAERGQAATEMAIMIVTYDFDRDRARMMRSQWDSKAANFPKHLDSSVALADAAHASSTAPVNWFDRPAQLETGRFWDGAMTGYNNPVLAGVSEAIAMGVAGNDIAVLSIGTSATALPRMQDKVDTRLCQARAATGFIPSLAKVGKMIVNDPPDAHTYIAHLMTGGGVPEQAADCPYTDTAVVRMNPVVQPVFLDGQHIGPPPGWSVDAFVRLSQLDIATVKDEDVELIKRLAEGWIGGHWYNQAIRHGGDFPPKPPSTPEHYWEIGHPSYAQAKAAWLNTPAASPAPASTLGTGTHA